MTDIVERLRNGINIRDRGPEAYMDADCTMGEAADEIERLREALEKIAKTKCGCWEIDAMARAALQKDQRE